MIVVEEIAMLGIVNMTTKTAIIVIMIVRETTETEITEDIIADLGQVPPALTDTGTIEAEITMTKDAENDALLIEGEATITLAVADID